VTGPDLIPQCDLLPFFLKHREELVAAMDRALASGRYVLGPELARLEGEFAAWLGTSCAVGVASGTDAITLALRGCGLEPGAGVLTVSHTAVATVAGIESAGGVPIFVDIDRDRMTMCPDRLAEALQTYRGRSLGAIVVVHLYGQPADMPQIVATARQFDVPVVEDCAQAHGAAIGGRKVGCWGEAAAFSFYPTKNLGAFGDAGMVVSGSEAVAERVRSLRQYGWDASRVSVHRGVNSRLDEVQAALLRVCLRHLDDTNGLRAGVASAYLQGLRHVGLQLPSVPSETVHAWHQFVVRTNHRADLRSFLDSEGIQTAIHYPVPVHKQGPYEALGRADSLAETERAASEVLSLPMFAPMTHEQTSRVIEAMTKWSGG
jgi:dTDP-4-amino-4,6-dideoxygalactose transaminase